MNGMGNVGIGTTDPAEKFHVNGNALVQGSVQANVYLYNSDRRYKSDITALQSPLENLLKLTGYSYYNKLSKKNDIGVIAQEVETVYPELVQTDVKGYKSVAYGNLIAPIIEAIKELAQKTETLTEKIAALYANYLSQNAKIESQEAKIQSLEARLSALEQDKK